MENEFEPYIDIIEDKQSSIFGLLNIKILNQNKTLHVEYTGSPMYRNNSYLNDLCHSLGYDNLHVISTICKLNYSTRPYITIQYDKNGYNLYFDIKRKKISF